MLNRGFTRSRGFGVVAGAQTVLDRSLKGVPFDVIALVNALSDMSEVSDTLYPNGATAGPLKQTVRGPAHTSPYYLVTEVAPHRPVD
jgi:hypothetical protein